MDINYTCQMSAGSLLMAEDLTRLEKNSERRQKKNRVLDRKRKLLKEAFPEPTKGLTLKNDAHKLLVGPWSKQAALTFLIDLTFSNPFAPYELKFTDADFEQALIRMAGHIGLKVEDVKRVRATQREAFQAYQFRDLGKVALAGVGGLVIIGLGGWILAPVIGATIGAAAGLSGAAATAHGLAILGGGSLAIGGMGMAGGMWVVTGTGAAVGLLTTGGATFLVQLGAAAAKQELVKLQVTFKEVLLGTQVEQAKSQEVIKSLVIQRDELKKMIAEERQLNEHNAARLKQMETTLADLEHSLKWMQSRRAEPGNKDLKRLA